MRRIKITPETRRYVIIAWHNEGINLYQLRVNSGSKQYAEERFRMLAEYEQWGEFSKIEVFLLEDNQELTSITAFLPGVLVRDTTKAV